VAVAAEVALEGVGIDGSAAGLDVDDAGVVCVEPLLDFFYTPRHLCFNGVDAQPGVFDRFVRGEDSQSGMDRSHGQRVAESADELRALDGGVEEEGIAVEAAGRLLGEGLRGGGEAKALREAGGGPGAGLVGECTAP